jgi:RHS repeat-associated protein
LPLATDVGEWLSLVEHLVRDQGVGGSNPLSPTITTNNLQNILFQAKTTVVDFVAVISSKKNEYGEIYQYGPDGLLLEETNASGAAQADYIYLNGRPVALQNGSTLYYLHDDRLGTPQMATDSNQAVQWQASYDAFGQASVSGTVTQNLRFPGQYFDVESGWNHNGFRDYAPMLGRYLEPDPLGRLGSGNDLYAYVSDNPTNLVDPLGLCQCQPNTSDKNTDLMLMSHHATPQPSKVNNLGEVEIEWQIAPQADSISDLSQNSIDATGAKYSQSLILLDESMRGGSYHWEGSHTGSGLDALDRLALPVNQKWYINPSGGNDCNNKRIQVVIGMNPDGTLIKAWTVHVGWGMNGPIYTKID